MLRQIFDFQVFAPSYLAAIVVGLAHQDVQQGTLADAIACDEGDALPFVDGKTDVAKQHLRPHRFRQVLN